MPFVNYNNREISVKIVYYGPALSGKTTCLRYIHQDSDLENKGKLITLDTAGDRTLFFDFLPIDLGKISGYTVKIQLYTVPGQVAYDTTRKMVLQGADGVVFVCDSQKEMMTQNAQSFRNLKKNLELNGVSPSEIPILLHYNKQDLENALPPDQISDILEAPNIPYLPTVAVKGENVLKGLKEITRLVLNYLRNKLTIFQQKDRTIVFDKNDSFAQINYLREMQDKPTTNDVIDSSSINSNGAGKEEDIFPEDLSQESLSEKEQDHKMDNPIFNDDDIFDLSEVEQINDDELELKSESDTADLKKNLDEKEINPFDTFDGKVAKMLNGEKEVPVEDEASASTLLLNPEEFDYEPDKSHNKQKSVPSLEYNKNKSINQNIPINIVFPKGKDEVTINFQITLKRE